MRTIIVGMLLATSACRFELTRTLGDGELRGEVFLDDAGTLVPAEGARVQLRGAPGGVATDARGRFRLRGLPAGTHALRLTLDRDGDGRTDLGLAVSGLKLSTGNGADLGRLVLGALGGVHGVVSRGGTNLPDVDVLVGAETRTRTDDDGAFSVAGLLPGETVTVTAVEVAETTTIARVDATVPAGEFAQVTLTLGDTPAAPGMVTGNAFLAGRTSHEGISLQLGEASGAATTDASGLYSMGPFPPGLHTLRATAEGYAAASVAHFVVTGEGDVAPDLTLLAATADCGLAGVPDTDADGRGDACDVCPAHADPGQGDADRDGTGDACERSLAVVSLPARVSSGEAFSARVELRFGGAVDPGETTTVTVRALRDGSEATLSGTTSVAAQEGVASFTGLQLPEDGEVELVFSAGDYPGATATVRVGPRVATQLVFTLDPPASFISGDDVTIEVEARDETGVVTTFEHAAFVQAVPGGGPGVVEGFFGTFVQGVLRHVVRVQGTGEDFRLRVDAGELQVESAAFTTTLPDVQPVGGFNGANVDALETCATDPDIVYAGDGNNRGSPVWRSTDGGRTFAPTPAQPVSNYAFSFALHPTDCDRLYVGAGFQRIGLTTDGGATWTPLGNGMVNGNGAVGSLVFDPSNPTTMWATTYGGPVSKSIDSGANWTEMTFTSGLSSAFVAVDPFESGTVIVANGDISTGARSWRTTDGGQNWAPLAAPFPAETQARVAFDATRRGVVLISSDRATDGLFRSTDHGATWTRVQTGPFRLVAVHPTTGEGYASNDGGMFRSTDGGVTWVRLPGTPTGVRSIAFDRVDPAHVLVGTHSGAFVTFTNFR